MSKEKIKSPEVKALETTVKEQQETIEKLKAQIRTLEIVKDVYEKTKILLKESEDKIESIKLWAEGFERFSDSDYKGKFIFEEITKVLNKEKTSDSDDKL